MKKAPQILKALDELALALANHGHKWTRKERTLYERSVKTLVSSPSTSRTETDSSARD